MPEPKTPAEAAPEQLDADGKPTVTPPEKEKQTAGKVLDTTTKEPKMVPEAAFLNEKKERKALEKRLKEIEESANGGATKSEISDEIEALGEEFGIDSKFLNRLSSTLEAKISKKYDSKLQPLEDENRQEKIDKAFNTHFKDVMEEMPEYKAIVNPEVIKALSLNPANANKTFEQIIEETYGNAITGKRTIETTTPGGGKEPGAIDFRRAAQDPKYLSEILANPETKKEYNKNLLGRLKL